MGLDAYDNGLTTPSLLRSLRTMYVPDSFIVGVFTLLRIEFKWAVRDPNTLSFYCAVL